MFQEIDAFVTASASAREIYDAAFPEIKDRLHIIEHGRDDAKVEDYPPPVPSPRRPIRILVPGNLDFHKGGDFLKAIKDHDSSRRLEFHFAGRSRDLYANLGVHHGAYERDDWFDLVEFIRPSFVGLFSVTAETFSHTLSEAWLAGLPVIATDLGALKDRIERDGGGWLIDSGDPKLAYQQILNIAADAAGYREKIANIPTFALRTAEQMAADYHMLYERVRASRRPLHGRSMPHLPTRVGLFVLGKEGARPASTYIRMLQRYFHSSSDQVVAPVLLNASTYVQVAERVDIDVAVVQRTAIPPDSTDAFIDAIAARNVPLVLDLDDDLMMIGTDHPDYRDFARFVEPIRRLVLAAAGVTVSTNALRASIASVNPNVFVVENHLDEHLWLSPVEPPTDSLRSPDDDRLQILYFGSLTHGEDLEILKRAVKGLEDEVAVTVVGGAAEGSLDWCRQMVPVRSWNQYPDFVHWLRRHSSDFDVVAIPLGDTEFNRAKSDLKFLEAAGLGLPAVCSRVEPYTLTVVDGKTGLLVDDDPEAWQDALRKLKADPALRIDLSSSALEYVREHRLLGQHVAELKDVLDHVGDARPGPDAVPVSIGGRPGPVEDG
jgi:glycosyltransferase involved in cell wall biosynthesis